MNRFFLIPVLLIDLGGGTTSKCPKYLRSLRNPTGYPCRYSASRYGRDSLWLVRVMDISEIDGSSLIGMSDVYTFPDDLLIELPITDKEVIDVFFEGYNIPTDWTTPSTTYRELLRSLANIADILQGYFGIAGEELFINAVTLDTRFRQLTRTQQAALQQAANEKAGMSVPINENNTLRQLLKVAGDYLMGKSITIGDFIL